MLTWTLWLYLIKMIAQVVLRMVLVVVDIDVYVDVEVYVDLFWCSFWWRCWYWYWYWLQNLRKVAWHEERCNGEVETPSEWCEMWEVAMRGRFILYGMLILNHTRFWSIVPLAIGCCSKWKQSLFCEPGFEILLSLCMRSPNTYLAIYVFKGGCWGIEDAFLPFSTDYRKFQDPRLSCQSEG